MKPIRTYQKRMAALLCAAALAVLPAMEAAAESGLDAAVSQIGQVQQQAEQYLAENAQDKSRTAVQLTLSYIRPDRYSDGVWALLNRQTNQSFADYMSRNAPSLESVKNVGTVSIPATGEELDLAHMLASLGLACDGLSVAGSWGGDCMELAQSTAGQADSPEAMLALQRQTFASENEGSSLFSAQDLRADLDAVVLAALLEQNSDLADCLQTYYADLTADTRLRLFTRAQLSACDFSSVQGLADDLYEMLLSDTGMQMLLAFNGMWSESSWSLDPQYETALQAAAYLMAETVIDYPPDTQQVSQSSGSTAAPAPAESQSQSAEAASDEGEAPQPDILALAAGAVSLCCLLLIVLLLLICRH